MGDLGQAPLALLVGCWRVAMATHATDGGVTRSDDLRSAKAWFGDGRYVREELEGSFGGGRHEKLTLLGYNRTRARVEYFTADNHDGVLLLYTSEPGADPEAREIAMTAEYAAPDETSAGAAATFTLVRTVIAIESRDRHVLRNFYRPGGRDERLFLELAYTREA